MQAIAALRRLRLTGAQPLAAYAFPNVRGGRLSRQRDVDIVRGEPEDASSG